MKLKTDVLADLKQIKEVHKWIKSTKKKKRP